MVVHDLGSSWTTPDWLPLAIVVALLLVIGLLYLSMRRNLNRIDVPPAAPTPDPKDDTPKP